MMFRSAIALIVVAFFSVFGIDPCAIAHAREVQVISFNIQFLGNSRDRHNSDLAEMLAPYDLIFVQELVAPPYPGTFPDGSPFRPDREARAFFEAMKEKGFSYVLSEEDTGTGDQIHLNSAATEWFVAFYKPDAVQPADDLPRGFLADDRSNHPDYERVPYAFPFRAGNVDLVFISVHLAPNASARARRAHELAAISSWIQSRPGNERDYIILGDMNIENCTELAAVLAEHYASLNKDCQPTNTNVRSPKPYDHVMYHTQHSAQEVDTERGLTVINLVEEMQRRWPSNLGPYPGRPYRHDQFRKYFSDHNPILFNVRTDGPDDD